MKAGVKRPTLLRRLALAGACDEAKAWVKAGKYRSASAAWKACKNPEWMLWALQNSGIKVNDKKLRLFACTCVRETPLADGRKVWDLLTDERSRRAVEVAERFARGEATQEELAAAWAAAKDAAWAAAKGAAWDAAWAAVWAAAMDAAWDTVGAAARDAAWAAARDLAWDAAMDAAWAAAWAAWTAQCNLLRKIYGNPFKRGEK